MKRSNVALSVGGIARRCLLAEPDGAAAAVILGLHGSRSRAEDQERMSGLNRLVDRFGAVVAYPEAIVPRGRGYEWDLDGDLEFLARVVERLVDRFSPPGGRVAVTGMSGGARMSCRFASANAAVVSMVGAVAGLRAPAAAPSRPVPILAFHGTADRINPYGGGPTARWLESVPDAARRWAASNGRPDGPVSVEVSATLSRTTYGSEGGPGEVTLWTSSGAGHIWPGTRTSLALRLLLGRTTNEIDATEAIWSFVQLHSGDP